MAREVTDQLYIDLGYFTPEDYYVYIAEPVSAQSAIFSFTAAISKTVEASSDQSSAFTVSCEGTVVGGAIEASANLSAAFTQTTSVDKIVQLVSAQSSAFTQTTAINYIADGASTQSSAFTQSATALKIIDFTVTLSSAFSPTMTVVAIRNSFAVLDSIASMSVDAVANRAANIALASAISQSLTGMRYAGLASNQSVTATQSTSAVKTASAQVALTSAFSPSFNINEIVPLGAVLSSAFTVSANVSRVNRTTTYTQASLPRFSEVDISSTTKKWGSGSMYAVTPAANTQIYPQSNVLFAGSTFYILTNGYTWTSSDALTWTRSANDLTGLTFTNIQVKYINSVFAFTSGSKIYTSSDALTWTSYTLSFGGGQTGIQDIEYLSSYYYVVVTGTNNSAIKIYRSTGIAFSSYTNVGTLGASTATEATTTKFTNSGSTLAVGVSYTDSSSIIRRSVMRGSATWASTSIDTGVYPKQLIYDGTTYALTGVDSSTVKKSTNLTTWSNSTISISGNPIVVQAKNSKWLVFDSNNNLYTGTTIDNVSLATSTYQYEPLTSIDYGSSKWVALKNESIFYSADASSWSSDQIESVAYYPGYVDYSRGDNTDYNSFGTIDLWVNAPSGNFNKTIFRKGSSTAGYELRVSNNAVTFYFPGGSMLHSATISTGWHHIRIVNYNLGLAMYVDGTRVATATQSSAVTTTDPLRFFGVDDYDNNSAGTIYVDEFLINDDLLTSPSNYSPLTWPSSITQPSGEFTNSANTDLLLHFNGTFEDDATLVKTLSGAAALTSTATETITANRLRDVTGALTSTATLSSSAIATKEVSAQLTSQFTLTATAIEVPEEGVITASAAFTLTATPGFLVNSGAILEESFGALTINPVVKLVNSSAMTSSATLVADVSVIPLFGATLNSTANLTADANRLRGVSSDLTTVSTLNATVLITRNISAGLSANASMTVANSRTRAVSIQTDALFSELAAVVKIGQGFIHFDRVATLTADIIKTADVVVPMTSTASLAVSTTVNKPFTASLASAFTQTTDVVKLVRAASALTSQFTQTTTAQRLRGVISTESSQFTISATGRANKTLASAMQSQATLSATANRIKLATANLSAVFTFAPIPMKVVIAQANITGAFNATMAFNVIHIDPYLTWKIQAENRVYKIQREDRDYTIREETRVYIIKG